MIIAIILIIIGFILLIKGADLLVEGASNIAKKYGIPEIIIGLTIVSIGTSMPELFVSITSMFGNYDDMVIGNVIGSNIANLLLILGISSIIRTIDFKRETKIFEIPMCLIFTLILGIICNTGSIVIRYEAIILILLFSLFILYSILMAKKEINNANTKERSNESILKNFFYILMGTIALKAGGELAVDDAIEVATKLHLSEKIIGVTILAIGTSLPELVTSISASIKNRSDIAIGNIIGSNIFNMLFIIGITGLINPIEYNISYNTDLIVLVIATIILGIFPFIPPKNKMSRLNGIIYLGIYIIYMKNLLT